MDEFGSDSLEAGRLETVAVQLTVEVAVFEHCMLISADDLGGVCLCIWFIKQRNWTTVHLGQRNLLRGLAQVTLVLPLVGFLEMNLVYIFLERLQREDPGFDVRSSSVDSSLESTGQTLLWTICSNPLCPSDMAEGSYSDTFLALWWKFPSSQRSAHGVKTS